MKTFTERLFYSHLFKSVLLIEKVLVVIEINRECPNALAYQGQLKDNKKSLINCYEGMIKSFDTIKDINVHCTMVYDHSEKKPQKVWRKGGPFQQS